MVNKIILASLVLMAITNPYSVLYIDYGLEVFSRYFVEYSIYGFVLSLVLIALVNIYMIYTNREKTIVPKKTAKTSKAGKYIED